MANHPSAEKRHRQTVKRTVRNRAVRTRFRNLMKVVREAVARGDQQGATTALKQATVELDKAVTKGVVHRSTASRSISRLTVAVNGVAASK